MAEPTPAPPSSASVGDRLRRRSSTPWVVSIAVVAVAAAIGVGAWLWIAAAPQTPPAITVEEFPEAPQLGTWRLEAAGAPLGAADLCEAGQDAALVIERDAVGFPAAVMLLDTATGEVAWTTPLPDGVVDAACATAAIDRGGAAITTIDEQRRSGLLSIDLDDGAITRPPGHLELLVVPDGLDGDIIASTGAAIGRFDLDGLDPVWTVRSTGASVAVGGGVVVVDAQVLSLQTGAWMPWSAGPGAYGGVDGALVRVDRDGASASVVAVDPSTGRDRWALDLGAGAAVPVPGSGLLLVIDAPAGTIAAVRVSDGAEQWSIDATLDAEPESITGSAEAGVVLLPITGDPTSLAVVDLRSGERRFDLEVGDPADPSRIVALTAATITLAAPGGSALTAVETVSGERRWRIEPGPDAVGGSFLVLGGRFVVLEADALSGIGAASP